MDYWPICFKNEGILQTPIFLEHSANYRITVHCLYYLKMPHLICYFIIEIFLFFYFVLISSFNPLIALSKDGACAANLVQPCTVSSEHLYLLGPGPIYLNTSVPCPLIPWSVQ
ncbi:hypothetical protein M758_1G130200 [Ceratodon purpureus]|uniref:Uncharacterized protein n=1 Tax=Ceratodon purpureus TaxID=3225 RepID=A0A8T0J6U7_CERPU|nr:hypothetical protein KC19_1G135400 [Ceratodon purpureus]KAG0629787.1 hypothetical protein M758_1G130200 [Ceratodon purpureus]